MEIGQKLFIEKENIPTCSICNKNLPITRQGVLNATMKLNIDYSQEFTLNLDCRKNKIELLKTIINNQRNFSSFSK